MYLKSIEVHGFKSFANKIKFEFHNGITGIVGPNGSGKSNVADAVRWVLGEQSAKQLRGGNMQDVIFSGTENRKPLSFASVSITLDNGDHSLDIEYPEVRVTRRLYRSGESEYLMNNCTCRLRDIQELFFDTGIGKEGYSIIGQGQIDQILNGRPEERRELFDEAAGIVKYKRRRNTAIKKLGQEQQNLTRVRDILNELNRQTGPLERQAETAKIYLKKKEELKTLEINLFLGDMKESRLRLDKVNDNLVNTESQLAAVLEELDRTKDRYEALDQDLESLESKLEKIREQTKQGALAKQQMEGQMGILREQISGILRSDEQAKERAEELSASFSKGKEAIERADQEEEILLREMEKNRSELGEKQETFQSLQKQISDLQENIGEKQADMLELLNGRSATRGKIQRCDAMLEQMQIRKSALSQKILQIKSDRSKLRESYKAYQEEFKRISQAIASLADEKKSAEKEYGTLNQLLAKQAKEMESLQVSYHRDASRLESLKNLAERYEGFGNSIKKVMEQQKKIPGIRGVVADLIKVEARYEMAIETALGGALQNIVTDSEKTAKDMIQYLKQGHFGRATFLPLTTVKERNPFNRKDALAETGVLGLASSLVETEKDYKSLMGFLLGRTLVVDTIDHALAIGRAYGQSFRMVTLEGDLINPGGSMTGGAFRNNSNLLGRKREIEELEKKVEKNKKELEKLQEDAEGKRRKRKDLGDLIKGLTEDLSRKALVQKTSEMQVTQTGELIEKGDLESGSVEGEMEEIKSQIQEVSQRKHELEDELGQSARDEKAIEERTEGIQQELERLRREAAHAQEELEQAQIQGASLKERQRAAADNSRRLRLETEELRRNLERMTKESASGGFQIKEKEERLRELAAKAEEMEKNLSLWNQALEGLTGHKEEVTKEHKSYFEKRDSINEQRSLLDKEEFRLRHLKEKLEESRESRIQYLWTEYEITPKMAEDYYSPDLPGGSELKQQTNACKAAIRKLGPVNVAAIEEYKEVKERRDFLDAQHQDLVDSEKTLQEIIKNLNEGMRRQFMEKFALIQANFAEVFAELFGGGKASLELLDDEDILEAGIRIIAQPPGKKLQNMMQLSGGEKALTAISLLFAIQNLKPSPFCLLDEIEAALDDSNVTRYAQYLHKLTKTTQFIIITHRKGTMTAADRLYGITMQEKGVSALVSVSLIENDLDQ